MKTCYRMAAFTLKYAQNFEVFGMAFSTRGLIWSRSLQKRLDNNEKASTAMGRKLPFSSGLSVYKAREPELQ